jgi:outer membrane protein assembly factor BamD
MMKSRPRGEFLRRALILLAAALVCLSADTGYAQKKKAKKQPVKAAVADDSSAPDKVLYDRALNDIKKSRHDVGRLTLQTLINTYPDSEYLAKAKLSIGDSFYKEGGSSNLTQAIASYKDFIVFFPFLPEAAYAQLHVAMAHYRQMEKPDRDRRQAHAAEDELQTFLRKYPSDPLKPQAEQRLREVQEVLAEGDFRVANYYYLKGSLRASASRLLGVTNRYPLYSKSDEALWMLGSIFERSERKDQAAMYYARIVRNYPLSQETDNAKKKLTALGKPVPQPDPQALAWMQAEQSTDHGHSSLVHKAMGVMKSAPDVHTASLSGPPNLEPETGFEGDVLTATGQTRMGGPGGSTAVIATVVPGNASSSTTEGAAESSDTSGTAAEEPKNDQPAATGSTDAPGGAAATPAPNGDASAAATGSGAQPDAAPAMGTPAAAKDASGGAATNSSGQAPDARAADPNAKQNPAGKQKESSSKKKKGLRKIIPW